MSMKEKTDSNSTLANGDIDQLVDQWIRPEVRAITAYHVPASEGMVKLDAMENPYRWPVTGMGAGLDLSQSDINRYPDAGAEKLKRKIYRAFNIPEKYGLLLGNGSDELIQMIAMALSAPGRTVIAPEPGFVMYRMIALMCNMRYVGVPLRNDFDLDLSAMLAAIQEHNPAVIFIAYPNNPTGNLFDDRSIEAVLRESKGLVVVDEAYFAFAGASFIDRLDEFNNLLIMRTVSKMGLAGLRLGYLVGRSEWIAQLDKMRLPYNINVLTQLVACQALASIDKFDEQTEKICADRQLLYNRLSKMENMEVFSTKANFILIRVLGHSSSDIFAKLREQRVLVKNLDGQHHLLSNCLRVTVGSPEENDAFLTALENIVKS